MSNSTDNKTNKNNMNICYIVGAGDLHEAKFEFTNRGLLIAADGGYKVLKHAKIAPDFVVGDFDSLKIFPKEVPTEVYSKDKDETDMMIAVNKGFDLGHNIFVIYGGLGGRFEHSMANIQLLTYIAKKEGRGYLIQGDKINVETKIISFGNKSMKMLQRLVDSQTGNVKSICQTILSGFNHSNNSSMVIPEEFKSMFLEFEKD